MSASRLDTATLDLHYKHGLWDLRINGESIQPPDFAGIVELTVSRITTGETPTLRVFTGDATIEGPPGEVARLLKAARR